MIGLVSLLMDISSELIHSLLPVFLVTVIGASALTVGLLEGAAEALGLIVKVFSGALSDYWGKRKGLAVFGYSLSAMTKPLFALSSGIGLVVVARFIDRIGKGIRGAPRDALVADIAPKELRGAAFGLRQSLDSIGAFLGPLLAIGLMLLWANDFRMVFWIAVLPGLLAVVLLIYGVKEPDQKSTRNKINPLKRENIGRLPAQYWRVVVLGVFFTLARFSEAFLLLRAEQGGMSLSWIPLVLVVMNIAYSISAYPVGRLADRVSHSGLLAIGIVMLVVADLILANSNHWISVLLGVTFWGLHLGMTQGLLSTMIAHAAPIDLRGTAFGLFNLFTGLSLFIASALAGVLWDQLGASATFLAGIIFCIISLLILFQQRRSD